MSRCRDEADEGQQLGGPGLRLPLLPAERRSPADGGQHPGPGAAVAPDQHVLQGAHVGEQADVLERAGHARLGDPGRVAGQLLAPVEDLARRRLQQPGEAVEERGLARPVGPDEADDLPLAHVEVDVVHRHQPAEALGDLPGLEDGLGGGASTGRWRRSRRARHGRARWGAGGVGPALLVPELPLPAPAGDDALGPEPHHQDQGRPEEQEPLVLERPQLLGDDEQGGRAQQRPRDAAHPAQHHRRHQQDRLQERVRVGRHLGGDVGVHRPRGPGHEGADGEGQQLEADGVDAHGRGRHLVLPDGHPRPADAAGVEPAEGEDGEGQQDQLDEVVVGEPGQGDAEQLVAGPEVVVADGQVGHAGDPVGAPGEAVPG